jgi:hypothetical protein
MSTAVSSAAARELAVAGARLEPFELFRRIALRATVEILVDPQLLADAPEQVDAYMRDLPPGAELKASIATALNIGFFLPDRAYFWGMREAHGRLESFALD